MIRIIKGKFAGKKIAAPKTHKTRPTLSIVREAVFNILQFSLEDALFLDVFAGSGSMGFEALSRGAKHCTFIDKSPVSCKILEENAKSLKLEKHVSIQKKDVLKAVEDLEDSFDFIYIDPPYTDPHLDETVKKLLNSFFKKNLLKKEGILFIEYPKKRLFPKMHSYNQKIRTYGNTQLIQINF